MVGILAFNGTFLALRSFHKVPVVFIQLLKTRGAPPVAMGMEMAEPLCPS